MYYVSDGPHKYRKTNMVGENLYLWWLVAQRVMAQREMAWFCVYN